MPRSSAVTVEANFSRGLITEATAMNYPENSVVEADNVLFAKNGKVIRRYGIDFELNSQLTNYSTLGITATAPTPSDYYNNLAVVEYEWTTVSDLGSLSFVVLQIGNILNFFEVGSTNELSNNRKLFKVDLLDHQVTVAVGDYGQVAGVIECSFSSGFGQLFVTHPLCEPFYVSYDLDTDTISETEITINVRDFDRLDDTYDIDERPSSLTDLHKYNLYNQGWYISAKNATPATSNVVTYWDGARTDWPSNADVWWVYKNASELLDSTLFDTTAFGNTPAPNGHYIYNAFSVDRDAVLGTTGLPESVTNSRPSTTAFYAGRVWYAGVLENKYNSKIYFSKIVESTADFGTCHQISDPTSESNADLLPSDGGVINIPDIAQVLRIVAVSSSLYIFATNGLWKVSGPNGVFTANDYSITKISTTSLTARNSVVVGEGIPLWWDKAGIYMIQFDPNSGQETVVNISEPTIQTLVNSIPDVNLPYVKGTYNTINKTVNWIYNSNAGTSISQFYSYNKLLVLNLVNQSFSPQTISSNTPKVAGIIYTSKASNDPLIDDPAVSLSKFVTIGAIGTLGVNAVTFSQFRNTSYNDWFLYDGVGEYFESSFITGYRVRGELLRKFQSNYIVVIMEQQTNASCLLQGVWDYSNSASTGRFTTSQQVYRSNQYADYSRTKRRIRGSGYSLQFKFYSEEGKPFTLVGWSTIDTGNNVP